MTSSVAELTHAAPGYGSSFAGGGGAAAGNGGEGARDVAPVATTTDSGLGGDSQGLLGEVTATGVVTTAAPTNRPAPPRSGFLGSAPAQTPARPAPAVPSPAIQSQAIQAFQFHASHSFSSSTPPPPGPSAASPRPFRHSILHAHRQDHNSSKLPAFRFTDLNKDAITQPLLLQAQNHHHQHHQHNPPSPVSPNPGQQPDTKTGPVNQFAHSIVSRTANAQAQNRKRKIVSAVPSLERLDPVRSRATTFQPAPAPALAPSSVHVKRTTSLDTTNAAASAPGVRSPLASTETVVPVPQRRAPISPNTPPEQDTDPAFGGSSAEATTENPSGQQGLLLLKTWQKTVADDKQASVSRKPPVSYKPRAKTSAPGTAGSVPPIRSFRSSGERRSVVFDMNVKSVRSYDNVGDFGDPNHRDKTLRALEGKRVDEATQWTSPGSAGERGDGEDTGDLFLNIAREDSAQRTADSGRVYADRPNAITRVARSARRPLSVGVSSYRSPSPPRISRRMSEQESRIRGPSHDQGERTGPPVSFRGHSREPQSEDFKFKGISTPLRASPLSPRTLTFHDSSDSSSSHRRRQPSIDRSSSLASRMASIKQANVNYSHPRAYNSSPLVSYATDAQKQDAQHNEPAAIEGTESTVSTGASSMVWDELVDLKSRIHRLEVTKPPQTSSAAISRSSEERPPTAHTNATTLSASPKRGASNVLQSVEAPILQKEGHLLLQSALAKSKDFLVFEIYDALEAATIDALALSALVGTAGQPGPISSGASSIGSNSGTVTDRQLRKKADGVCRGLTELCLALSENTGANKPHQVTSPTSEDGSVTSPTITQFTGLAMQRRPSLPASRMAEVAASPRALSRYEEKRVTVLASSALPHSRQNSNVPTTTDGAVAGRKSSLLFSRSRRAGTEEPEDGRRTSNYSRSRRAGTEEPEDLSDRKPILTRGRRATLDTGEEESRLRTPSRAITEVNGSRPREYVSHLQPPPILKDVDTLANSALPRRRLGSTTLNTTLNTTFNSRLAQPAVVTPTTTAAAIATPSRRYFDRSTSGRDTAPEPDRVNEDRSQRQFTLARSGSLNRRVTTRQSMIATPSNSTTSYYR